VAVASRPDAMTRGLQHLGGDLDGAQVVIDDEDVGHGGRLPGAEASSRLARTFRAPHASSSGIDGNARAFAILGSQASLGCVACLRRRGVRVMRTPLLRGERGCSAATPPPFTP
jgi:hypothetical protein